MQRIILKSKIHRATVTDANIEYEGSITLDEELMDAAGLLPYEQVSIYNVTNGERFQTYVIKGERGPPGKKGAYYYNSQLCGYGRDRGNKLSACHGICGCKK